MSHDQDPRALLAQLSIWFEAPPAWSPALTRFLLGLAADLLPRVTIAQRQKWQDRFTHLMAAEIFPQLPWPSIRSGHRASRDGLRHVEICGRAAGRADRMFQEIRAEVFRQRGRPRSGHRRVVFRALSALFPQVWSLEPDERAASVKALTEFFLPKVEEEGKAHRRRVLLDDELQTILRDARGRSRRSPIAAARVAASLAGPVVAPDSVRPPFPPAAKPKR